MSSMVVTNRRSETLQLALGALAAILAWWLLPPLAEAIADPLFTTPARWLRDAGISGSGVTIVIAAALAALLTVGLTRFLLRVGPVALVFAGLLMGVGVVMGLLFPSLSTFVATGAHQPVLPVLASSWVVFGLSWGGSR